MKRILVAPDSFKGSITAGEVCQTIKDTVYSIYPDWIVDMFPMADGGEGTVEAVVFNTKGVMTTCSVEGPLGKTLTASYGIGNDGHTAIMEMAEASGITHVTSEERNPMETSTIGVGQMILDALDKGCREILLGIGGSATNDGGMGMLTALGYIFYDKEGKVLKGCGGNLGSVDSIDDRQVDSRLKEVTFAVACDVDNPLIGDKGATYVYGPQKGATEDMLAVLEAGMTHYAQIVKTFTGLDVAHYKGAGAAGGLGAALVAFLQARLESGFTMVSEAVGLEAQIEKGNYDLIITGEGQINHQTLHGKLPYGVASLGKKHNVPVIAIVGAIGEGYEPILEKGMAGIFSIVNRPMPLEAAMAEGKASLSDTVMRVLSFYHSVNPS